MISIRHRRRLWQDKRGEKAVFSRSLAFFRGEKTKLDFQGWEYFDGITG